MVAKRETLPPLCCPRHGEAVTEDFEQLRAYACGCTLDLSNGVVVNDDDVGEIEVTWSVPRKRLAAEEV